MKERKRERGRKERKKEGRKIRGREGGRKERRKKGNNHDFSGVDKLEIRRVATMEFEKSIYILDESLYCGMERNTFNPGTKILKVLGLP